MDRKPDTYLRTTVSKAGVRGITETHKHGPGQAACQDAAECWRLDQEIARIRRDKAEGRF